MFNNELLSTCVDPTSISAPVAQSLLQGLPTNSLIGDEVLCTNTLDSSPSGSWFQLTFNILPLLPRRAFIPSTTQHDDSNIMSLHSTSGFSQRTDIEWKGTADISTNKILTSRLWFPEPLQQHSINRYQHSTKHRMRRRPSLFGPAVQNMCPDHCYQSVHSPQ